LLPVEHDCVGELRRRCKRLLGAPALFLSELLCTNHLLLCDESRDRNNRKQERCREGQRLPQTSTPARSFDEVARCTRQLLRETADKAFRFRKRSSRSDQKVAGRTRRFPPLKLRLHICPDAIEIGVFRHDGLGAAPAVKDAGMGEADRCVAGFAGREQDACVHQRPDELRRSLVVSDIRTRD
jgi:hypothetical protein